MALKRPKIIMISLYSEFLEEFFPSLEKEFEVQRVTTTEQAQFLVNEWEPDIALIDTDSPFSKITKTLHLKDTGIGLFTFSRSFNLNREEEAFRSGADHFLVLPIEYMSLYLRVKNWLMRRPKASVGDRGQAKILSMSSKNQDHSTIRFKGIHIFPHDFLIKSDNQVINATPTQFKLLLAFVSHKDQLLSRDWIKSSVWGNADISPRSIDAQISKLKKLLPELDQYLVNIYGKGYILTQPQEDVA